MFVPSVGSRNKMDRRDPKAVEMAVKPQEMQKPLPGNEGWTVMQRAYYNP